MPAPLVRNLHQGDAFAFAPGGAKDNSHQQCDRKTAQPGQQSGIQSSPFSEQSHGKQTQVPGVRNCRGRKENTLQSPGIRPRHNLRYTSKTAWWRPIDQSAHTKKFGHSRLGRYGPVRYCPHQGNDDTMKIALFITIWTAQISSADLRSYFLEQPPAFLESVPEVV